MGFVSPPTSGRTFKVRRSVRLADMDNDGRLRLDALARYLQDAAIDDVRETGWGLPDHLWFIRRVEIEIEAPFLADTSVELVTWSSGLAAIAAARRWSLRGDAGGRAEVDSVWIHLGPDGRPARIESFGVYADAAGGRRVSTKIELPAPPDDGTTFAWPLRSTDIDLHDHVNNAVYWQAVEHRLTALGFDPRRPLGARLDYGDPVSLGDAVEVTEWMHDGVYSAVFAVDGRAKAFARIA
ncbi:MAG TPA: acyl-ACP thioesterase domain-containing protein [Gaiellaceae bacterium]|nr:acyl-ACP thioesterase domain-containing protein [Gaiellaceae bacterium]